MREMEGRQSRPARRASANSILGGANGTREKHRPAECGATVDKGFGKIRPRARLIRALGEELISNEIVAILELVRNCYDADAHLVEVHFTDPHRSESARLEIRDDGHGMSKDVLLGPWLEPATDYKSAEAIGPYAGGRSPGGRRRLGSKGVGRFATQRLGSRLRLSTRTDSGHELQADFDWQKLEDQGRFLDQLRIPWREVIASRDSKPGTCLTITNLIDRWTPERFERLELALSRLVDPGVDKDQFQIRVAVNGETRCWIKPAIDSLKPMYSIQGHVGRGGRCDAVYRDINGVEEQWERSVVWPEGPDTCGPFSFRIHAWDLDRDAFNFYTRSTGLKLGIRDLRRLIRDHSGISLYRDGFRILPYGEPDNDWLRLDRRRVNNPTMRLSNNQILGVLNLTADDNPALKDQTNREGLVTNDAYDNLHAIVLELLGYLETRRFSSRRSIGLKSQQNVVAVDGFNSGPDAAIDAALERLQSSNGTAAPLVEIRDLLCRQRERAADAIRNYAGWAATGQMTGLIVKQLEHPLRQARSEIAHLIDESASLRTGGALHDELTMGLKKLSSLFDELSLRVDAIGPHAFGRLGRRASTVDLQEVVTDVLRMFLDPLVFADIRYEVIVLGSTQAVIDRYVLQQSLALVLDNAIYWVSKVHRKRCLKIEVADSVISVSNNGPAIDKANIDHVFKPGFTTRKDASGMGLSVARDLLKSIGARIVVDLPIEGSQFRIVLPSA